MIPFQYEKMVVHKEIFTVKNELLFPFVYISLHIATT